MRRRAQSLQTGRVDPQRILSTHLSRVLFSAAREQRTGVLTVDEGAVHTDLHLRRGGIEYASQGPLGESLGRLLVQTGTIDRSEYRLILELMSKPSSVDEVMRFGEVAINHGMLAASELHEALALQVRRKLEHCLLLTDAIWAWRDDLTPREGLAFPTPLEPVVIATMREEGGRWREVLWALREHRLGFLRPPEEAALDFEPKPAELRALREADGRPVEEILRVPHLDAAETSALLAALSCADRIRFDPPRVPSIPPPTPPPTSQSTRAREAALRLREEMKRRRAAAPTSTPERIDAEQLFERGRDLLARGGGPAARELFEKAVEQMPEAAEYVLHLRWCEWLEETDPARRTAYEVQLEAALLEALRQDRRMAFAHYVRGRLDLQAGDEDAAYKAFRRACASDPSDVEARRYLRLLRGRRE